MATAATGWACTHSASIIAESNTSFTIRVICYWQNSGWRYDINNVSAWVYCGSQSAQVLNAGAVDSSGIANTAALQIGYADFSFSKTHSAQSISCYAKITSNSSYVSGTKSSSASSISVAAKPTHTITYNANGGTGAPAAQTKWYSEAITLSTTKPTRTGYSFQNWNTNTSNTGTSYAPGATYNSNANLTLYAIWKANTYTVTYNANGGSGAPAAQTKTYGVNLTLSSTKPTRTNYNFKGWATSASGSVVYAAGGTYTNNAAVTLYAVWELAYVKPRITNFTANRCTSDGTVSETGTYIKVSFSWATDKTVTGINVQYKLQSASSWSGGALTYSGTTSGTVTQAVGQGNISVESSYHVRVYVTDSGGTTYSYMISIGTVKFPIDIKSGGTGVAIGKVAEIANKFDVGWNATFRGYIDIYGHIAKNSRIAKLPMSWLNADVSFNDALTTGIYDVDYSALNGPYQGWGYLDVQVANGDTWNKDSNWIWQTFHDTGGVIYQRSAVNNSAFTSWKRIMGETTLYDGGTTGIKGAITLSQSAANFYYLEIYYGTSSTSYNISTRIAAPNGKICRIKWVGSTYSYYKDLQISGTSVTNYAIGRTSFKDGTYDNTEDGANTLYIRKIVGWK